MVRPRPRVDPHCIAAVLAEVNYPAPRWHLLVAADHYGAGVQIRAELARLPAGVYRDFDTVLAALTSAAPESAAVARSGQPAPIRRPHHLPSRPIR